MLKIFLLSADPKEGSPLNVDVEFNKIDGVHKKSDYRDDFSIEKITAANYDNLLDVLMSNEASIIHFSGHGVGEEGLVLVDENGNKNILRTETLTKLISVLQEGNQHIKCVFLNGCYTQIQAETISPYVEYVIGMSDPVYDKDAVEFAKYFYQVLFAKQSIEKSFQVGCISIGHAESSISIVDYDQDTKRAVYDPAPEDEKVSQPIVNYKIPQLIINKKLNEPRDRVPEQNQVITYEQWKDIEIILSKTISLEILKNIAENTLNSQGYDDFRLEIDKRKNLTDFKKLLLEEYPYHKKYRDGKNQESATVFEFVKQILETNIEEIKTEPTEEDKKQWLQKQEEVKQWLEKISKEKQLTFSILSEPIKIPLTKSKKVIKSHFLISLIPNTGSNKSFRLIAELVDFYDDHSIERNRIECQKEGINNIQNISSLTIEPYILELINHRQVKRKKSNLIIEIFVLYNYFNVDFGLCKIPHRALRSSPLQPLSSQYPLVLRSLERCKNKDNLESKWQELNKITKLSELIKKVAEDNRNNLIKYFHFYKENHNWQELYAEWEQETELLSVVITDQIPLEEEEYFFDLYEASGVPITLWTRKLNVICDCDDATMSIQEKFKQILMTMESLQDLSPIFKEIHHLREFAHNKKEEAPKYLGYHLGFICDNPELIPNPKSDVFFQL
ncbi:MAG: CHAT domain-containing protein [Xenococcaceae cyanobacterium MO_167.B52]|nr:CHAT domain-containing protein [Xenococcaceae cyanobacterium MO_167.B52]